MEGTADLSKISFNGVTQVPSVSPTSKAGCKKGGWKTFNDPKFKNQGQCVSYVEHHTQHGHSSATLQPQRAPEHGNGKGKNK